MREPKFSSAIVKHQKGLAVAHLKGLAALIAGAKDGLPDELDFMLEASIAAVAAYKACYEPGDDKDHISAVLPKTTEASYD